MKPLSLVLTVSLAASTLPGVNAEQKLSPSPTPNSVEIDRTKQPAAGPLPAVKLPDAVSETLPNGLQIFVIPDHRQPTITYRLLIKSGELFDGEKPGRASLTAELLNKGTSKLSADQFAQETDFLGAKVEADAGDDSLAIVATGLAKDSDKLLGFLHDVALDAAFKPEELDKEKTKAVAELAQKKANPADLAARLRDKLLYGNHPYGANPTPESVQSLTRDDVTAFYKAHFLPNNATLAIVGDVDPKEALTKARKVFADWKPGDVPKLELPEFPKLSGVTYHLVDRPASVQSNVLVARRGIARNNPDAPEVSVVNSVLGGGFSGRLFANLREKNGYTYGAYSGFASKKLGGGFTASAQVRNEVTAPAITEIFNELKRITSEPVPEKELDLQKTYLAGNFLLGLENNRRSAERLQEVDLFGLPKDYYQHYAERLTAVTPEKAEELAKKYIDPKDLVVVIVGKADEVRPALEKLGKTTLYDADLKPKP